MLDFLNMWEKHFLVFLGNVFTDPIAFSLAKSCCETLYMVLFSTFFAVLFGLPLGVLLSVIKPSGIMATPSLYKI